MMLVAIIVSLGFLVLNASAQQGCGRMLTGYLGTFTSPGYPWRYSNNLACTWTLQIPANGVLKLDFLVFDTESGYDFVELTDSSGRIIDRLSGSLSPFDVTVEGNTSQSLNITFTSDYIHREHGFLAQYNISTFGCGGMLTGYSGTFMTPGLTSRYSNNLTCTWTMQIPANALLKLQFLVFDTESGYDFVELTDSSGRIIESFSGYLSPFDVTVKGNTSQLLNITFTSDYEVTDHGFLAQYAITFGLPEMPNVLRNISTSPVVCKINTTCSMFCYLSSDEPAEYNWTKNGQPLTGDDINIMDNVLVVTPRIEEDYGVYVCQATNSAGSAEYEMTLKMETDNKNSGTPVVPPLPRNISTPTIICKLGTTCGLFCYMSSNDLVRYTWTKNGKPMTGNDVTIMDNVLIITPRSKEDYGMHVCKATNSAGSAEYEIDLRDEATISAASDAIKGGNSQEESRNYLLTCVVIVLSCVVFILVIAVIGCYLWKRQRNEYRSDKKQVELQTETFDNPTYPSRKEVF